MINRLKKIFLKNTTTQQTVIKNTSWLFLGEILSRVFRALLLIIAARILGSSQLGVFSYTMALAGIFMFFEDSGISMYIIRELIKHPDQKDALLATASTLKIILLTIASLAFLFLGPFFATLPGSREIIFAMMLIAITDSLREFGFLISRAQERMEFESLIKLITAGLVFSIGLILIVIHPTALMLSWGYALGGTLGLMLVVFFTKGHFKNPFKHFSKRLIPSIWESAWPFTILLISNVIIFNTDIFLLGHYHPAATVGGYTAAQRLIQLCYVLPSLFATATFPAFARKTEGYRDILEKSLSAIILLAIPLVIGIVAWSSALIRFVFGQSYVATAGPVLIILGIGLIPIFITSVYSNAVFANNKQKQFVVANIIGMIGNIILNILLTPHFGALGAAGAGLLSFCLIWIITIVRFRSLEKVSWVRYLNAPGLILTTLITGIASYYLAKSPLHLLIGAPIALAIYLVGVFITHRKQFQSLGIAAELDHQK